MSATRCSTEAPTGAGRNPYRGVKRSKLQFERGRMRAFFVATSMAAIIGMLVATGAIAHESWFVRVCPTNRSKSGPFGLLRRPTWLQLVLD